MKPNGYTYKYKNKRPCDKCNKAKLSGGLVAYCLLYEVDGEKWCRECAKEARVL